MGLICLDEFNKKAVALLESNEDYNFEEKEQKYFDIALEDFDITQLSIKEKLCDATMVVHRWNRYHFNERMLLKRLENKMLEMQDTLTGLIMSGDDPRFKNIGERALKAKVEDQPIMRKYLDLIDKQIILIEYVDGGLKNTQFNFRNQTKLMVTLLQSEEVL